MRTFADTDGREWEVVAGRESWGAFFAIFIPTDGGSDLRQALLEATSYAAAHAELEDADGAALRALLARSNDKSVG